MSEELFAVCKLSKDFGGVKALKSLDFNISSGEIHGLIGPNGAGKTTLINLISGLEKPSSGKIFFKGERIDQLPPELIFEMGISRTFQDCKIVSGLTVFENIAVGLISSSEERTKKLTCKSVINSWFTQFNKEKEIKEKVENLIEMMDLSYIANRWANELVWFERQLVQISRAVVSNPQLLLLDEPTSGMGSREKRLIEEKLININKSNVTIILISHDMSFIRNIAKRITVLDFGSKISEGLTEQVLSEQRVQEAYLGIK